MPSLDTLSEVSRKTLTFFPCMEFEDLAKRMNDSDDAELKSFANGLAR